MCVVSDNLEFIFGVPKHELETFYYLMRNLLDLKINFYMKIQTLISNILLIKKPKKKKKKSFNDSRRETIEVLNKHNLIQKS